MVTTNPQGLSVDLETTFDPGLRFTCTKCGACCRHVGAGVGVTESDSARLGELVEERMGHPIFTGVLESEGGVCDSLSGMDCSIYQSRPLVCKLYPFYVGVGADGTLQLSVDHCPGVNLPDAELVDANYVQREISSAFAGDEGYLASLREQVLARKGDAFPIFVGQKVEVSATWNARKKLWSWVFWLLESGFPMDFSPRDRLECLKVDLVPWVEETILSACLGRVLDDDVVERSFVELAGEVAAAASQSAKAQEEHRKLIQSEGRITGQTDDETTTFHTRTGDNFTLSTREVLRMRGMTREAFDAEMSFLKELVRREFVYQGVAIRPLTFREEASLLYYVSDAVELMANAAAARSRRETVGIDEANSAICETDAHILSTVQELGVQIPANW